MRGVDSNAAQAGRRETVGLVPAVVTLHQDTEVLDEANGDDDGRPGKSDEKDSGKNARKNEPYLHNGFRLGPKRVRGS